MDAQQAGSAGGDQAEPSRSATPRSGVMAALVTPLNRSGQTVDHGALGALVDRQIAAGVTSILALGGTGEYVALPVSERRAVVEWCVAAAGGRVPVICGILDPGLPEAVGAATMARDCGAAGAMVVTPYYSSGSQSGMYDYYSQLSERLNPFEVILYNIPAKTSVNLLPATVNRICRACPNVVGIKECAPRLQQVIDLIELSRGEFDVLSGDEVLAVASLAAGADGLVMATANLFPELWVDIFRLAQANDYTGAFRLYRTHSDLIQHLFEEGNPGPLKWALAAAGRSCGPVLSPLLDPSPGLRAQLTEDLRAHGYDVADVAAVGV